MKIKKPAVLKYLCAFTKALLVFIFTIILALSSSFLSKIAIHFKFKIRLGSLTFLRRGITFGIPSATKYGCFSLHSFYCIKSSDKNFHENMEHILVYKYVCFDDIAWQVQREFISEIYE